MKWLKPSTGIISLIEQTPYYFYVVRVTSNKVFVEEHGYLYTSEFGTRWILQSPLTNLLFPERG